MNAMISRCPVCAGGLHISEVACGECGTRVHSQFEPCRFCALAPEQLRFVELFLRSRGNLSSVGEELDISYPTVTRRLDAVLAALRINGAAGHGRANGLATEQHEPPVQPAPPDESERLQILEMLDRGEITAEEATRRLKEL